MRKNHTLLRYIALRFTTQMTVQMIAVAVGYEIYELTGSALWLGFSGLVQFLPRVLFLIPTGTIADKYDRRFVAASCQAFIFVVIAILAVTSLLGNITPVLMLFTVFCYGTAYSFQAPSLVSLLPNIVSKKDFPKATARVSSLQQTAIIIGPAIAGFIYIYGSYVVYFSVVILNLIAIGLVLSLRRKHIKRNQTSAKYESPLAGFRYIWKNQGLFGAMSLDMFAVLFSGVTALLPIFANDILHAGSVGFGFMRTAPAIGALIMSGYLSLKPIQRRTGKVMFACVFLWGLLTIGFAFSVNIVLSCAILVVMGALDMISMVIRSTYVQVTTDDEVRGRVTAVNFVFIGASNQLGEFESGVVAALGGAVFAAAFGGVCTLFIVGIWYHKFKELRELDRIV